MYRRSKTTRNGQIPKADNQAYLIMDSSLQGLLGHTDDGGLGFTDENSPENQRKVSHPVAALFHVVFRVLAVLVYLFCGWFSSNFIGSFVIIVLLLSADFWTVKNVTGRLLVGLRWWNYIDQEGKSHWMFESRKAADPTSATNADSRIFWLALFLSPVLWLVFFFVTIFGLKLKWFMVVCIGLTLNFANLYGYLRCRIGHKENLSTAASSFFQKQVVSSVISTFQQSKSPPTTQTV